MEEPTFTAIDYNSLENKVIEGLVRDNYSKVKNTFWEQHSGSLYLKNIMLNVLKY